MRQHSLLLAALAIVGSGLGLSLSSVVTVDSSSINDSLLSPSISLSPQRGSSLDPDGVRHASEFGGFDRGSSLDPDGVGRENSTVSVDRGSSLDPDGQAVL